jgi:hypothetical protein
MDYTKYLTQNRNDLPAPGIRNVPIIFQVTATPAQVSSKIIARERYELENQFRYQI